MMEGYDEGTTLQIVMKICHDFLEFLLYHLMVMIILLYSLHIKLIYISTVKNLSFNGLDQPSSLARVFIVCGG